LHHMKFNPPEIPRPFATAWRGCLPIFLVFFPLQYLRDWLVVAPFRMVFQSSQGLLFKWPFCLLQNYRYVLLLLLVVLNNLLVFISRKVTCIINITQGFSMYIFFYCFWTPLGVLTVSAT
jgi:hypothetical protein